MCEKIRCLTCGGELEKRGDGIYLCPYCSTSYLLNEATVGRDAICKSDLMELQCIRCGGGLKKAGEGSYICSCCQARYTIGDLYCQQGNRFYKKENYIEAEKWYRRAAEQGIAEAGNALEQLKKR